MEISACSIYKEWKSVRYPNRPGSPTRKEIKNFKTSEEMAGPDLGTKRCR